MKVTFTKLKHTFKKSSIIIDDNEEEIYARTSTPSIHAQRRKRMEQ